MSRICLVTAITLLLMFHAPFGYGFEQKNGDCIKCHSLDKQEAELILKNLHTPDAKILDIRMSSIKGMWEVSFQTRGRPFVAYVDFSKKYVTPGPIVESKTGINLTRQKVEELERARRVDISRISLENALVLGKKAAPIKVVVFTDPD